MRVARFGMRVPIHLLSLIALAAPVLAAPAFAQSPSPGVPLSPPGAIARPGVVESAPLAPPPGVSATPDAPPASGPSQAQGAPAAPGATPVAPPPAPLSAVEVPPAAVQPAPAVPVAPPVQTPPLQAQPLPGSPIVPAPGAPVPGSPLIAPPVTAQPLPSAQGAVNPRATLVPVPGDPANVDDVTLSERPVAIISGMASWNEGYARLAGAAKRLEDALAKAGVRVAGRPLSRFLESDDLGFRYDMMIPVESVPGDRTGLSADIQFGTSPGGRAIRFSHKAPYDEIDGTYEAITAYLDAKGVTVNDSFLEEYVSDLTSPADPATEINIFVMPK